MSPVKASQQDEADFMQALLAGLDTTISTNPPLTPSKSKIPKRVERVLEKTKTPNQTPKKLKKKDVDSLPTLTVTAPNEDIDMNALLEGAEDWNWDDMNDFLTPKKTSPKKPRTPILLGKLASPRKPLPKVPEREYQKEVCTRCFVESIAEPEQGRFQKKLTVKVESNNERRSVILQDDWFVTDVRIGDTVNIIGTFTTLPASSSNLTSEIHITSKSNYLILHPDNLITATALSNAIECLRKPLLSSLVRSTSDVTPALVWGNILHEVMQLCLVERCWEEKWIEERIEEIVMKSLVYVVRLEMSAEDAIREVKNRAKGLVTFARKYLTAMPTPEGVLTDTRATSDDGQPLLAITDLMDVEEDIWSPTYGLKGKIDATVHTIISHPKPSPSSKRINHFFPKSSSQEVVTGAVPFEIKTGRSVANIQHRAQTMLYTLLVQERYHQEVESGLLYYTQREEVVRVPVVRNELRGLVIARNEMAGFMVRRHRERERERGRERDGNGNGREVEDGIGEIEGEREDVRFLPNTIDDERICKRCYVLDTCMLYRRAVENVEDKTSPIANTYEVKTSHLTRDQLDFFKKWERLISLEERDIHRFKKELWMMGAEEREKKGRCFSLMVMDKGWDVKTWRSVNSNSQDSKIKTQARMNGSGNGIVKTSSVASVLNEMDVDVDVDVDLVNAGKDKIHKFTYRFVRASKDTQLRTQTKTKTQKKRKNKTQVTSEGQSRSTIAVEQEEEEEEGGEEEEGDKSFPSLLSGQMGIGEPITVSVEPDLLALARGFVVELTPTEVVVGVDHELDLEKIGWRLGKRQYSKQGEGEGMEEVEVVFRIDKDDLYGGMARIRDNLAQMFYAEGDKKRLELVVDLREPQFEDFSFSNSQEEGNRQEYQIEQHTKHLNQNQKYAVEKVLNAKDYTLILGMPGTGKTSVIASLVKVLVGMGKSVLLSAYTHSAVDNVLLRLCEMGEVEFGVLRLGNLDKIHPDVHKFTLASRKQATTIEQLEMQLMSPPVVATTCLSVDHALFSRRKFDYCIVDEASQITLPTCLGPLRFAETFVLVGDHFQLPPLVRSTAARQGGLDISLFRRLSDAHPKAVVELAEQYRMNEDIMTLSNRLIYGERLKCGSEAVRNRKLVLPKREVVNGLCTGKVCGEITDGCWLAKLLDERCKAVFVDTDGIPARESRSGDLIQNEIEAELVCQVTEALILGGVSPEQIGVIALYRQQVKLISHLLGGKKDVEILTADRSQGRDKDCIIFSMVRSNDEARTGELVRDWRRMNVSFTRARSKLIIFGSRKTLESTPLLKEFFELMDEKGWVMNMPDGAHAFHNIDSSLSSLLGVVPDPTIVPNDIGTSVTSMSFKGTSCSKVGSGEAVSVTPSKRCGPGEMDMDLDLTSGLDLEGKENTEFEGSEAGNERPFKRMRKSGVDVGILKGKVLLQDVINGGM